MDNNKIIDDFIVKNITENICTNKPVQIQIIRLIISTTIKQFEYEYKQLFCQRSNDDNSVIWNTLLQKTLPLNKIDESLKQIHLFIEEYLDKCINDFFNITNDRFLKKFQPFTCNDLGFDISNGTFYNLAKRFSIIITDKLWEDINTGLYMNVSIFIRQLYAYHKWLQSLLHLLLIQLPDDNSGNIIDILIESLKLLDNGLIMSPDLKNNLLSKMASMIHRTLIIIIDRCKFNHNIVDKWKKLNEVADKKLLNNQNNENLPVLNYPIKDIINYKLEINLFEKNFLKKNLPFIIRNGFRDWPCLNQQRKWTLKYLLNKMAFRNVPVEIGSKYTSNDWIQKIMPIYEFMDKWILQSSTSTQPIGYMAQHNLFDQIFELNQDIDIPIYCAINDDNDIDDDDELNSTINFEINAWFGPANTVSPIHFDCRNNFFLQVMGTKYIRLYSPETPEQQIYPNEKDSLLWNTSKVDYDDIDDNEYPNFKNIDSSFIRECFLQEGDILFIPKNWWHYVRSCSDSFSINYWW